jgi:O-acetyl-ADP-ribose deacetylase (regulator of RNase III)
VIHTVGPVWHGGNQGDEGLLASCYRSCFAIAEDRGIRTIAFPSISTGAYGFPIERAGRIALGEARDFLSRNQSLDRVAFVCFGQHDYGVYQTAAAEVLG